MMDKQRQPERFVGFAAAIFHVPYGQGDLHEGTPDDVYAVLAIGIYDRHRHDDEPMNHVLIEDDGPCGCDTINLWR